MELLRRRASARAGLMGNPSDGYHGKTLSVTVREFRAQVVLYEWEDVEIVLTQEDRSRFRSVHDLAHDVELHGYYGGIRLVKATVKKFVEYCEGRHALHDRNFSIRYETDIPRSVGLAGSSAIIVATMRALMDFYRASIPQEVLPSLVLSVERDELKIAAGLQDRVVQVYGGLVFMDFSRERTVVRDGMECGVYEPLPPSLLPPLYLAYGTDAGEPTEVLHNDLRARYERGDPDVVRAMSEFAELAQQARDALVAGRPELLGPLMNRNFDLRQSICRL
ncbi:MAG: GHMP kinase, partial [Planctomycetes bacterium]|nr:GHMP kinase [Planctomycetota bacterium]